MSNSAAVIGLGGLPDAPLPSIAGNAALTQAQPTGKLKEIEKNLSAAPTSQLEKYGYTRTNGRIVKKTSSGGGLLSEIASSPLGDALKTLPGIGPLIGPAEQLEKAAPELGIPTPSKIAEDVVKAEASAIAPAALPVLLYAVLVIGGVALAAYGITTMIKPGAAGGLAKKAALAVAA